MAIRFILFITYVLFLVSAVYATDLGDKPPRTALIADGDELAITSGGSVQFTLNAGSAYSHRNYYLLGSLSRSEPGTPLPGGHVTLPLNWDLFTNLTMANANNPCFQNFHGKLDSQGAGDATLDTCGSLPAVMVGMEMRFAFLTYDPYDFASNSVGVKIIHTLGWHYLQSFPNYAPCCLPDFDQKQDPNW